MFTFSVPGPGRLRVRVTSPTEQNLALRSDCAVLKSEFRCSFFDTGPVPFSAAQDVTVIVAADAAAEAGPYSLDVSFQAAVCGDGIVLSLPELCEPGDLGGLDCLDFGLENGTLACSADCLDFDTSGCIAPVCGDGVVGVGEACDSGELQGRTCEDFNLISGALACAAGCDAFDTSACLDPVCGNSLIEGSELCDGAALGGATCQAEGFPAGGTLTCAACVGFDTSGCGVCHDVCVVGNALDATPCPDPCIDQVCDVDPFCCDAGGEWDFLCVDAANSECGSGTCP